MRKFLLLLLVGFALQGNSAFAADQYGYDKGFFLRSADENYMFKARGLFDFQYLYQSNDGVPDNSTLKINRGRTIFSGNAYSPDWTYLIQAEMASGALVLLDYAVNWHHCDAFNVQFGQYRIPYSREVLVNEEYLLAADGYTTTGGVTVNRSLISSLFAIEREIGISVWGAVADKKLEYALSVSNGNGANTLNPAGDVDFRYTGRFVYHLMGNHGYWYGDQGNSEEAHFAIGGGVNYNRLDLDADAAFDMILGLTGDLAFAYRGWDASFEYHFAKTDFDAGGDATNQGIRATLGYFIMPGEAELAAHLSWFEPDAGARIMQAGPILSWFLQGRDVKLQFEYDFISTDNAADTVDHQVIARTQFFF